MKQGNNLYISKNQVKPNYYYQNLVVKITNRPLFLQSLFLASLISFQYNLNYSKIKYNKTEQFILIQNYL